MEENDIKRFKMGEKEILSQIKDITSHPQYIELSKKYDILDDDYKDIQRTLNSRLDYIDDLLKKEDHLKLEKKKSQLNQQAMKQKMESFDELINSLKRELTDKGEEIMRLKEKYQNYKNQSQTEIDILQGKNKELAKEAASMTKKYEYSKKIVKETKKKLKEYKKAVETNNVDIDQVDIGGEPEVVQVDNVEDVPEMDKEHQELVEVTS